MIMIEMIKMWITTTTTKFKLKNHATHCMLYACQFDCLSAILNMSYALIDPEIQSINMK